ncbi:rhamnulokinase [Anaerolentibacter hominis]|uniref:rhamnulokinase n=1 Tax=Anaerolentibacter hominis TaxID=3079009 RepID=UPI0031B857A3
MTDYYLAVDIGASSGRHILGHMEKDRLVLEEIHRFDNELVKKDGETCWDLRHLFEEIKTGMKRCRESGKIPVSMGVDTWAVDFVLLDKDNSIIGNTVAYRDKRTEGMDRLVYQRISERELYARTGIQKLVINTIYQLMAVKERHPEYLEQADSLLMLPDYFHYLLTGIKRTEYTNATSTQLVSPVTKDWDRELIRQLGYPEDIFQQIVLPGTGLGCLTEKMQQEVGFNCRVVLPATHDTGSAVMAVPSGEKTPLYISSGTWSLLGVERFQADCSEESRLLNFTNEGGYDYRFRYLKNIMGLWMIQSLRREEGKKYSYAQYCELAEEETIDSIVDCNDGRFLAPDSMIEAVQSYCMESGQQKPVKSGELARVIYRSLAGCYEKAIKEAEQITGITYPVLHIVGGGANAEYLNRLTARAAGKTVLAGPVEATAIGNLIAQMLAAGVWESLSEARECVYRSFPIEKQEPSNAEV